MNINVGWLLSENARRFPDRPALIYENRTLTFAELDEHSNRVANALRARGIERGRIVALLSRNRPEWVEVFFGAAKVGAILVPLNFRLKEGELAYIASRVDPDLLLVEEELAAKLDVPAICFERDYESWLAKAAGSRSPVELAPGERHSIFFTSGTTGAPKGAVLTHDNMVVGTHEYSLANIGYTRDDVFLNPTPLCHRAGCARLVQSVGVGAAHVLMRKFDPDRVFELIARHRVTMSGFVPTMIRLMAGVRTKADLSSMKRLLTTGEACPPALKETVFELFPGVELITSFASTEAGIIALSSSFDELAPAEATGRPLPEIEVRIEGELSEIQIRSGPPGRGGVMLEYWKDPEANRAAFHEGWFATGDCGFLDEAGYLYVTDRKKDMILSGGLNIYSKEVEACLLEHPAVLDVAVVGRPDPLWGESVAAFVVRREGEDTTESDLIRHCEERIASYKKPTTVCFVGSLPRNAAGKTLKYRLRERLKEKQHERSDTRR